MTALKISPPQGFLKDEPRTIVVSAERKALWAVLLDLAQTFDRVCRAHGIRYFIDGGTLLGAVRHRGFVPWDDDFDVVMDRGEYERLCAIAPTAFKPPYFFQTDETDPGSARGHAQLRNSDTTAILKAEMANGKPIYSFNQGVFVDIFPFDNVPDDPAERERFLRALAANRHRVQVAKRAWIALRRPLFSLRHPGQWMDLVRGIRDGIIDLFARVGTVSRKVRAMERLARKYERCKTKFKAPVALAPYHREVLPAVFFRDDPVGLGFEFLTLPAMRRHLEVLEINYGNWRKQVVGANEHGGLFVDLDHPYTHYLTEDDRR